MKRGTAWMLVLIPMLSNTAAKGDEEPTRGNAESAASTVSTDSPGRGRAAEMSALPRPYSLQRYRETWRNSPFRLEVAGEEVKVVEKSFAKDLVLAGLLERGEGIVAYVRNRKTDEQLRLVKDEKSGGITLVEATVEPDPRESVITITDGKETVELGYEKQLFAKAASEPGDGTLQPPGGSGESIAEGQGPRAKARVNPAAARKRLLEERSKRETKDEREKKKKPSSENRAGAKDDGGGRRRVVVPRPSSASRRSVVLPRGDD